MHVLVGQSNLLATLLQAAQMYYEEDIAQQIADALRSAVEEGVVTANLVSANPIPHS